MKFKIFKGSTEEIESAMNDFMTEVKEVHSVSAGVDMVVLAYFPSEESSSEDKPAKKKK